MSLYYKHIYIFLFTVISWSFTTQGQVENSSQKKIPFTILKTTDNNLNIDAILNAQSDFKSAKSFSEKTHPDDVYWIRLDFLNIDKIQLTDSIQYLKFNSFGFGQLFYQNNLAITNKSIGRFDKNTFSVRIRADKYFSEVPFKTSELIKNRFLYLKVKRISFLELPKKWQFSYHNNTIEGFYSWKDLKSIAPIYIFIGICIIMSVFMLVFFAYFKRLEFFFYFLYVFGLLVYLVKDELVLVNNVLSNNTLLNSWLLEDFAIFIGISYMLFTIYYLDLKRDYNFVYQVFKISIGVHVLMLLVDAVFYFSNNYIGHIYILKTFPVIDSISAFLANCYILLNIKNRISILYIIGSAIFMIGVGHYFYFNIEIDPLFYDKSAITISSTIEIIIFAYGLTYKVHIEHLEKLNFQKEAFVNKTKALRAQINPHFIFNSLSSIQNFITSNDKVSALKYLSKFSRLTRNILESSIETNVVLEDEIKMLKNYLELETLRFDGAFTYQINLDKNLNTDSVEVPFMILQPFVENAIIHGLLPKKEGQKVLTINLKKEDNFVVCEVDDNGVGRQIASQKEHIHKKEKKSRGLEVTKQRLEALNNNNDNIEFIDKIDGAGFALGTKVIIRIPF